jgi:hypothetical protein
MRTPAALSATLAWLFVAQIARAQTPTGEGASSSAAPESPPAKSATAKGASTSVAGSKPRLSEPALVVVPAEPDQPALEPIADARDRLGGHFVAAASGGVKWPFGSHSRTLGTGLGLNLDLGFGLGRSIVLGAWGEFDSYSAASNCSVCSGKSFAGGPFLRYHIVQGTRFDPWGAIAVGVRSSSVDIGNSSAQHFGPELLKLTLGGDWYPSQNFAFGPYVTLDLGTFGSAAYAGLGTGLRLVLDLPGK